MLVTRLPARHRSPGTIAIALSMLFAGGGLQAAEVTLRLHQFLPAQANVPAHVLDVWADRVEADSDGRIEVQRFPSMQLGGKPPELYDQVVDGVADIVWTLSGYTPGRFPHAEAFELPFMMSDAEATSRAYWQFAEETMMETELRDVKPLGLWVHGPGQIHSKRPITLPADLDGVTLRAPTRITSELLSALGGTAIGMPVPAVPEALSRGVIDATVIPWEVTTALKVAELVDYHTEFGDAALYTATFIFAMNRERYASLPDDLKAVIDDNSGEEFSAFAGRTTQEYDAPARQLALDEGNTIIELDEQQVRVWRDAAASTITAWQREMDDKGLDGTALVARARELIAGAAR